MTWACTEAGLSGAPDTQTAHVKAEAKCFEIPQACLYLCVLEKYEHTLISLEGGDLREMGCFLVL